MFKRILFFFFFLYLTSSSNLFSQSDWKLIKNESGIKIYSRPDSSKSSQKELKIVTEIQSTLAGFITLFSDKASYPKWVYRCASSELLKKISDMETYHYQVADMPWPVQNRDIVIHTLISQNPETKEINIACNGVSGYRAKNDNYIRVTSYRVSWKLVPKPNNKIDMEYIMSVDPGGSLPSWLINMTLTDGPMKTITNLRNQLSNYQNAKLAYIKN